MKNIEKNSDFQNILRPRHQADYRFKDGVEQNNDDGFVVYELLYSRV